MASDDRTGADPGSDDGSEDFRDLFSQYVDRLNEGKPLDVEEIRTSHPGQARELIEKLRDFEAVGTLDVDSRAP